jgi:hypothetical protein
MQGAFEDIVTDLCQEAVQGAVQYLFQTGVFEGFTGVNKEIDAATHEAEASVAVQSATESLFRATMAELVIAFRVPVGAQHL